MSNIDTIPVTVKILEKEYKILCPQGEHESLIASAQNVNDNMVKVRESGKALCVRCVMLIFNENHCEFNAK